MNWILGIAMNQGSETVRYECVHSLFTMGFMQEPFVHTNLFLKCGTSDLGELPTFTIFFVFYVFFQTCTEFTSG